MENDVKYIDFQDLIKISSGKREDGTSKSVGTISEIEAKGISNADENVELTEKDVKTLKEVTLTDSLFHIYASGGCAVIDVELPLKSAFNYRNIMDICKDWMKNLFNEKYNDRLLSLTIIPLALEGQVSIVFQNLVYYAGMREEDKFKVILCFDNNATDCYEIEGINYKEIQATVARELKAEEEELDRQILEVEDAIKKLDEANNPYAEAIKEQYNQKDIIEQINKEEQKPDEKKGVRFTSDD